MPGWRKMAVSAALNNTRQNIERVDMFHDPSKVLIIVFTGYNGVHFRAEDHLSLSDIDRLTKSQHNVVVFNVGRDKIHFHARTQNSLFGTVSDRNDARSPLDPIQTYECLSKCKCGKRRQDIVMSQKVAFERLTRHENCTTTIHKVQFKQNTVTVDRTSKLCTEIIAAKSVCSFQNSSLNFPPKNANVECSRKCNSKFNEAAQLLNDIVNKHRLKQVAFAVDQRSDVAKVLGQTLQLNMDVDVAGSVTYYSHACPPLAMETCTYAYSVESYLNTPLTSCQFNRAWIKLPMAKNNQHPMKPWRKNAIGRALAEIRFNQGGDALIVIIMNDNSKLHEVENHIPINDLFALNRNGSQVVVVNIKDHEKVELLTMPDGQKMDIWFEKNFDIEEAFDCTSKCRCKVGFSDALSIQEEEMNFEAQSYVLTGHIQFDYKNDLLNKSARLSWTDVANNGGTPCSPDLTPIQSLEESSTLQSMFDFAQDSGLSDNMFESLVNAAANSRGKFLGGNAKKPLFIAANSQGRMGMMHNDKQQDQNGNSNTILGNIGSGTFSKGGQIMINDASKSFMISANSGGLPEAGMSSQDQMTGGQFETMDIKRPLGISKMSENGRILMNYAKKPIVMAANSEGLPEAGMLSKDQMTSVKFETMDIKRPMGLSRPGSTGRILINDATKPLVISANAGGLPDAGMSSKGHMTTGKFETMDIKRPIGLSGEGSMSTKDGTIVINGVTKPLVISANSGGLSDAGMSFKGQMTEGKFETMDIKKPLGQTKMSEEGRILINDATKPLVISANSEGRRAAEMLSNEQMTSGKFETMEVKKPLGLSGYMSKEDKILFNEETKPPLIKADSGGLLQAGVLYHSEVSKEGKLMKDAQMEGDSPLEPSFLPGGK